MNFYIDKITAENYPKFDDMIYWRINGKQRAPSSQPPEQAVVEELQNPNLSLFAIGVEDIYVGWISLIYLPKVGKFQGHGHIYVDELWVAPAYRNQGCAKRLLAVAEELKEELSAVGTRLYVNVNNPCAKALYEKCGFAESGTAFFMEK